MPPKTKGQRLPAARIKRIMRTDEEIGKVAQITPVLIGKAVESFLAALVAAALKETTANEAKKMTSVHVYDYWWNLLFRKAAVTKESKFDFLLDRVNQIPDLEVQDDGLPKKARKPRKKKVKEEVDGEAEAELTAED